MQQLIIANSVQSTKSTHQVLTVNRLFRYFGDKNVAKQLIAERRGRSPLRWSFLAEKNGIDQQLTS
jgi:hypothetical protein